MRYNALRSSDPTLLILTSLAAGPRHGYAITRDVQEMTGVRLGPGTLYGALARLEDRGLVQALPAEGRRRPYRLTAAGADSLDAELNVLARVTRSGLARLAGGVA